MGDRMSMVISGVSSPAPRPILTEVTQSYRTASGVEVEIQYMSVSDAAAATRSGGTIDLVILPSQAMAQLEADGHLLAGHTKAFARSGMAIAVRAGAALPDIGDEDAVRLAFCNAHRIGYSTGLSGDYLLQLVERWGLSESLADRLVLAPAGVPVGRLVAQGEVDLGFQQLSELKPIAGIEIVGSLPPDIQVETVFSAGVGRSSMAPEQALSFIAYLTSDAARAAKRAHDMEPMS